MESTPFHQALLIACVIFTCADISMDSIHLMGLTRVSAICIFGVAEHNNCSWQIPRRRAYFEAQTDPLLSR